MTTLSPECSEVLSQAHFSAAFEAAVLSSISTAQVFVEHQIFIEQWRDHQIVSQRRLQSLSTYSTIPIPSTRVEEYVALLFTLGWSELVAATTDFDHAALYRLYRLRQIAPPSMSDKLEALIGHEFKLCTSTKQLDENVRRQGAARAEMSLHRAHTIAHQSFAGPADRVSSLPVPQPVEAALFGR